MESQEIKRIKEVYEERYADPAERKRWSYLNTANLFIIRSCDVFCQGIPDAL